MALPSPGAFTALSRPNASIGELLNAWLEATRQLVGAAPEAVHTIAGGAVAPTAGFVRVDTEGESDLDDLDRISPAGYGDGAVIEISVVDGARAVRVRHAQGGSGQILLVTPTPLLISSRTQLLRLHLGGSNWREIDRAYGSQTADARAYLGLGDLATRTFASLLPASSGDFTVSAGGKEEWTHGLGEVPARFWGVLRCVSADAGYEVGECVLADGTFFNSSQRMVTLWANDTLVGWVASAGSDPLTVVNYATGAVQTVSLAKWRLRLYASLI